MLEQNSEQIDKKAIQSQDVRKEAEIYTHDKDATDKFEVGVDNWKDWLEKNNSRLGQAALNPENPESFKKLVMDELITHLLNEKKGRNYMKQLLYVAKYGSGEFQKQAKEFTDDAKLNHYGEFPDIVDPAQEAGKAVEDANVEAIKKAALANHELLNNVMEASLANILESPTTSIPKWKVLEGNKKIMNSQGELVDSYRTITWTEVSNQILSEVETGQTDKIIQRLRANIQGSELDAIKLTLELLQKCALGQIKNESSPDGAKNAKNVLSDIYGVLQDDVMKAEESFDQGDITALDQVIGYEFVADAAHDLFLKSVNDSHSKARAQQRIDSFK